MKKFKNKIRFSKLFFYGSGLITLAVLITVAVPAMAELSMKGSLNDIFLEFKKLRNDDIDIISDDNAKVSNSIPEENNVSPSQSIDISANFKTNTSGSRTIEIERNFDSGSFGYDITEDGVNISTFRSSDGFSLRLDFDDREMQKNSLKFQLNLENLPADGLEISLAGKKYKLCGQGDDLLLNTATSTAQ